MFLLPLQIIIESEHIDLCNPLKAEEVLPVRDRK